MAGFLAGSPLLRSQQDPFRDHSRVPGLNELVTAFDFEPVAYAKVPRYAYDYTAYGTDSEFTLRRNRQAFDWVELIPNRVLDARPIRTATEIIGAQYSVHREQRLQLSVRENRRGGQRPAVVSALSEAGTGRQS